MFIKFMKLEENKRISFFSSLKKSGMVDYSHLNLFILPKNIEISARIRSLKSINEEFQAFGHSTSRQSPNFVGLNCRITEPPLEAQCLSVRKRIISYGRINQTG